MTVSVIVAIACSMAALCLWQRERVLGERFLRSAIAGLAFLALATSTLHTVLFWRAPSYERSEIAAALEATVPSGASIGGDWAPLLTVGTELRSMYISPRFNPVERLPETRPDFVLYSATEAMVDLETDVAALSGVELGPSRWQGRYLDRALVLFPVLYDDSLGGVDE